MTEQEIVDLLYQYDDASEAVCLLHDSPFLDILEGERRLLLDVAVAAKDALARRIINAAVGSNG